MPSNQQKIRPARPAKIAAGFPAYDGNFQLQQTSHGKKVVLLY
jgi:hypothetical protein